MARLTAVVETECTLRQLGGGRVGAMGGTGRCTIRMMDPGTLLLLMSLNAAY